jgi:hypothetical protein
MVQRCQEIQLRTWCSSRAANSLLPANPSSTFQRNPATLTSWANGTGPGAWAREKAYSPSLMLRRISSQCGPLPVVTAGSAASIRAQSYQRLITRLDQLAARRGYELTYSVGWELGARERAAIRLVPAQAWQIAIDQRGEVRERRTGDACPDRSCGHPRCWVEEGHVTELTGLLREGPHGDQLAGWPAPMRVFARRERPHPVPS